MGMAIDTTKVATAPRTQGIPGIQGSQGTFQMGELCQSQHSDIPPAAVVPVPCHIEANEMSF